MKLFPFKTLTILSWTSHFLSNFKKHRWKGPLTINELLEQRKLVIRKVQEQYNDTGTSTINKKQLNVKVS